MIGAGLSKKLRLKSKKVSSYSLAATLIGLSACGPSSTSETKPNRPPLNQQDLGAKPKEFPDETLKTETLAPLLFIGSELSKSLRGSWSRFSPSPDLSGLPTQIQFKSDLITEFHSREVSRILKRILPQAPLLPYPTRCDFKFEYPTDPAANLVRAYQRTVNQQLTFRLNMIARELKLLPRSSGNHFCKQFAQALNTALALPAGNLGHRDYISEFELYPPGANQLRMIGEERYEKNQE